MQKRNKMKGGRRLCMKRIRRIRAAGGRRGASNQLMACSLMGKFTGGRTEGGL